MKKFNGKEKKCKFNLVEIWESLVLAYKEFTKKPSGRVAVKLLALLLKVAIQILFKKLLSYILF